MQRRHLLVFLAGPALAPFAARAHHGWSGFDQERPLYLQGSADKVVWQNPHALVTLRVAADLRLPPDLPARAVPAQSAAVDGPKILTSAKLPARRDAVWEIELAPLTRLAAWQVPEIQPRQRLEVVGFTTAGESGAPVLRAEYLFLDGRAFGLRSSPA